MTYHGGLALGPHLNSFSPLVQWFRKQKERFRKSINVEGKGGGGGKGAPPKQAKNEAKLGTLGKQAGRSKAEKWKKNEAKFFSTLGKQAST